MEFTPREIVKELDRFIVGQEDAKKAVAIALRNRYRRSKLQVDIREEITPKNIILEGPTGVGKTEIARRLAKIVGAPFVKVEATKFTEVGYVGRDVESMIRDLVGVSIRLVREEKIAAVREKVKENVAKLILKTALSQLRDKYPGMEEEAYNKKIEDDFKNGKLDKEYIDIEMPDSAKKAPMLAGMGLEIDIADFFGGMPGNSKKKKKRKVTIEQAMKALIDDQATDLIDEDAINEEALRRAESDGIIFIDEIDKITSKSGKGGGGNGPDVSREGVQRDILPIVEGSTVSTKYGTIKTDFILFIAAGAFHIADVSDLIPELQGRFPVRVKLNSLTKDDFINILKTSENALLKQYTLLLAVDNVNVKFTEEAIEKIAEIANYENETSENIGARRLHTILEKLLEDISFRAGEVKDQIDIIVNEQYVEKNLNETIKNMNLRKYII